MIDFSPGGTGEGAKEGQTDLTRRASGLQLSSAATVPLRRKSAAPGAQYAYRLDFVMKMMHILWPNAERAFVRKIHEDVV